MKKIILTVLNLALLTPCLAFAQYLMSDMEKGSSAAIQMQNNIVQSQYLRQNAEAQLQSRQNDLERQRLEIEKMKLQLETMKQAQELAKLKAANGGK